MSKKVTSRSPRGHREVIGKVVERSSERSSGVTYPCSECPRVFGSEKSLHMHKVKSHGAPIFGEKSPYIDGLTSELARVQAENKLIGAELDKSKLQGRLSPAVPPPNPLAVEVKELREKLAARDRAALDTRLDAIEKKLDRPAPSISRSSTHEGHNPLAAKVAELEQKLVDKDRDALNARLDSIEKKLDARPVSSGRSNEKVEFAQILSDAVDKAGDRIDRKIAPVLAYVFQGNLGDKEYAPGAQDSSGVLKKLRPEWIVEE